MKYLPLLWGNLGRHRARTILTLLSAMTAFLLFGLLIAVRTAFTSGVNLAGADRLVTMSSISLVQSLPLGYAGRIATVPGVREVSYENWVGGYFQDPRNAIVAFAVEPRSYLDIYTELRLPQQEKEAWFADRRGALVGKALAQQFGWQVGQVVPLKSNIWRSSDGDNLWPVKIDGIYDTSGHRIRPRRRDHDRRRGRAQRARRRVAQ